MKSYLSLQSGLSLVELMVAVTLGLLVTGAVFAMYLTTSRSFTQDERYAWMQENGRYALNVLTEDLSMADFWGQMTAPDTIGTALAPPAGNCGNDIDMFDASTALLFNNYHADPANIQFTPSTSKCAGITSYHAASRPLPAKTDMLVIKRVEGDATARTFIDVEDTDGDGNTAETLTTGASALQNGDVYLRTNGTSGNFINDASSTNLPALGEGDWRYIPRVYFIRDHYETVGDGTPALCRMDINGTGLGAPECIAEGVEDLHVLFGVDTDGDGVVNQYLDEPTTAEMEAVVTLRIYLLVRSVNEDSQYTNSTMNYKFGNLPLVGPFNDNFFRRVYSTTVSLRNPLNLNLLN